MSTAKSNESMTVLNLRCEYLIHPIGIDAPSPRLSWELTGNGRNQQQSAYQIFVASSPELLHRGKADLWKSPKIISNNTAHIRYAGLKLTSTQKVFWKVRVWDNNGIVSAWSEVSNWTMGLLQESDWTGKWIGLEGKNIPKYLRGTNWIVFPPDHNIPSTQSVQRYYRRVVVLPPNREVKRSRFLYTGDDACSGWINGRGLGSRNDHHRIKDQDLTFRLTADTNVIALIGVAPGNTVKSGGVVGLLEIEFMEGESMLIPTDERWKVADTLVPGWNDPGFNDSLWIAAKNLGPVGPEPWGEVKIAEDRRLPARWLRKEFNVPRTVQRATVFYSGLGWSEIYLNGKKIGDHVLSPGMTEYPKRVFYVAFDVTSSIREGPNAIGAILGNGRFYSPRSIVYASMPTFGFPKLQLCLHIEYKDGSVSTVVSDETWKVTADGPIVENNDYDGEKYDARKELGDWSNAHYDDSAWKSAEIVPAPSGKLTAQMIEPIRVTETLKPIALTEPKPGRFVFDLGQNIVGWCRLMVSGTAGTVVTLRHAETLLPDGTLSLANMRSAEVTDTYTLKGQDIETWEPRFATHGFRYVEIRGFPGKPDLQTIEGRMVNDDMRPTGEFISSNPLLNNINRNIKWGLRGNYKSIPMDCPQRDERQGWLGDHSEECRGEAYMFDIAAFYSKWMQDIRDVQTDEGSLPDIAPAHWPGYPDDVSWPSSSLIVPNALYEQYADTEIIARNYECAKKWMNYMRRYLKNGIISRDKWGDWCVPPQDLTLIHSVDPQHITSKGILATTYYYHDARLMERFANMLGYSKDATYFAALADTLKDAFNKKYYNSDLAQYDNGTQTSFILPLAFGMVSDDQRTRVFNNLVKNITELTHSHVGCGVVGSQYLYRVLSDNGRTDLAYTIATQADYPGYGYMISKGATTIWELWNGDSADPWMNSGNHVMLVGDFVIWLYEYLAGIKSDPVQPGFKHLIMKPHLVGDLKRIHAFYHSIYGEITSEWQNNPGKFEWRISIPPNTTATISLPAANADRVKESGLPAARANGVKFVRVEKNCAVFDIGSGVYHFEVLP